MMIGEAGFTQKLVSFITHADHSDERTDAHSGKSRDDFRDKCDDEEEGNRIINIMDIQSDPGQDSEGREDTAGDTTDGEGRRKKRKIIAGSDDVVGRDDQHTGSSLGMTSKERRPSKNSSPVSADNSSSLINSTGERQTQIMESADLVARHKSALRSQPSAKVKLKAKG